MLVSPPERSSLPHGSSPRSSCDLWVRCDVCVLRPAPFPSAERRDVAVVADRVVDVQERQSLRPVHLVSDPGEPCHGG